MSKFICRCGTIVNLISDSNKNLVYVLESIDYIDITHEETIQTKDETFDKIFELKINEKIHVIAAGKDFLINLKSGELN